MEMPMKSLLSLIAVSFAFAIVTPALAEKPPAQTTKAQCDQRQDWEWDESQGKCVEQSPGG
jgi:hypothetical protein